MILIPIFIEKTAYSVYLQLLSITGELPFHPKHEVVLCSGDKKFT
jgi:hypothetical protein